MRRERRWGWSLGLALVATLAMSSPALAQGSPDDHVRNAEAAEAKGDFDTALREYLTADAMSPSTRTLEGIANAHYRLGNFPEAYAAYEALIPKLDAVGLVRTQARERFDTLKLGTGLVSINVPTVDAEVRIDGRMIGKGPLVVTRRLRVGKHQVSVAKVAGGALDAREIEITTDQTASFVTEDETPKTEPKKPLEPSPPVPSTPGTDTEEEPWEIPHGSRRIAPVRATIPPKIDGALDDDVWRVAPRDDRFISTRSKPFGKPTREPTTVQVAYDHENLYIAFRCTYSKSRPRDDSFAPDEQGIVSESESVTIAVDPLHGHTNAFTFTVSRVGARADAELAEGGWNVNQNWRGIWHSATHRSDDAWTAEIAIPWGTIRMPSASGPVDVGVNFTRREPGAGELAVWSPQPPATDGVDTNFFGHLDGLIDIRPDQRLYIQPYVALAYDQHTPESQSVLTDFTGTNGHVRGFAGLYGRYQPPGPVRFDATFNPNFVGVNPDQALANFDRFELEFPEQRPFFTEDTPRFQFGARRYDYGDLGAQLFYSRRIGLRTNRAGFTEVAPILYGVKSVLRSGGTEAAAMNVGLSPAEPRFKMNDNVSVARASQSFSQGRRVGAIILARDGSANGSYVSGGVDGTMTLFNRHLAVSGFYARSNSNSTPADGAGQLSVDWESQDFYASASYLEVGRSFDAQLGYFPLTGVRSEVLAAGYTPVIRNDLLQQILIESQLTLARDQENQRIFDRAVVSASAITIDQAMIQVQALPAIEQVYEAFPLGNGRINVEPGRYDQLGLAFNATTAPRRRFVGALGYQGGDLFGGKRRSPSTTLGLNLGRFSSTVLYRLFLVEYEAAKANGHQVSAQASYAYTPFAKSSLMIETNTFSSRGLAQFVTAYTFGQLSTIALVVRAVSGSTLTVVRPDWYDEPNLSAVLSFAYGVSPF